MLLSYKTFSHAAFFIFLGIFDGAFGLLIGGISYL